MSRTLNVMVVDNEKLVACSIVDLLEMHGYRVKSYYSAESALDALQTRKETFDVIVTDINMPKMDGYSFIERLKKDELSTGKILVLTGYGSIDGAVKGLKLGASGYFEKDRDPELLLFQIKKIAETIFLQEKMTSLEQRLSSLSDTFYLFGSKNSDVCRVFELAKKVAPKDVNILITGESGTGKEILARYIHQNSMRSEKSFLAVNCSAIPDSLFESEMFGYVEGAFTGAVGNKKGFFEQAHGGTLMLDEIGEMPTLNQAKLLKVLEEKTYCPVGSPEYKTTDCRIISATNQNLQERIGSGGFRSDFYFRINTVELYLPPLRARREDILDLAEIFRNFFNRKYQANITGMTKDTEYFLLSYDWPGNIRELKQVIERCVLFARNNTIDMDVLRSRGMNRKDAGRDFRNRAFTKRYKEAKRDFDKMYFSSALRTVNYNITELAKRSGLNRSYIYQKIKDLGLTVRLPRSGSK
ncbi:MAG: sigma-54-dependent Fis family transcriptional regulator [Spirochaetes bacterium]|nr:sigma-54-dependent Fis family transcriptional regulator [Spirochaetota bacterium]